MREIRLTNSDKKALVDDIDYYRVRFWKWGKKTSMWDSLTVIRTIDPRYPLANFIMNDFNNIYDHKDRNPLNNQKENLRIATRSQNNANRKKYDKLKECSSQYKGVSWHKVAKKWMANIRVNKKTIYLGLFTSEIEAAKVYDKSAIKYFGEFACLNFPKEDYQ